MLDSNVTVVISQLLSSCINIFLSSSFFTNKQHILSQLIRHLTESHTPLSQHFCTYLLVFINITVSVHKHNQKETKNTLSTCHPDLAAYTLQSSIFAHLSLSTQNTIGSAAADQALLFFGKDEIYTTSLGSLTSSSLSSPSLSPNPRALE